MCLDVVRVRLRSISHRLTRGCVNQMSASGHTKPVTTAKSSAVALPKYQSVVRQILDREGWIPVPDLLTLIAQYTSFTSMCVAQLRRVVLHSTVWWESLSRWWCVLCCVCAGGPLFTLHQEGRDSFSRNALESPNGLCPTNDPAFISPGEVGIIIANTGNQTFWRMRLRDGAVSVIAGVPHKSGTNTVGVSGLTATQASRVEFCYPRSCCPDPRKPGRYFLGCDVTIRLFDSQTGLITHVAGWNGHLSGPRDWTQAGKAGNTLNSVSSKCFDAQTDAAHHEMMEGDSLKAFHRMGRVL